MNKIKCATFEKEQIPSKVLEKMRKDRIECHKKLDGELLKEFQKYLQDSFIADVNKINLDYAISSFLDQKYK